MKRFRMIGAVAATTLFGLFAMAASAGKATADPRNAADGSSATARLGAPEELVGTAASALNVCASPVVARHSGMCMDVTGASFAPGTDIIQWPCHGGDNQQFQVVYAGGADYMLVAKHSGLCMDVRGASMDAGAHLQEWPCHGGDNQRFRLVDVGGGNYLIVAKHSGQCLDVTGASTAGGANIIQYTCHGGDNQRFSL